MKINHCIQVKFKFKHASSGAIDFVADKSSYNRLVKSINQLKILHHKYKIKETLKIGKKLRTQIVYITFPFDVLLNHYSLKQQQIEYIVQVEIEEKLISEEVAERVAFKFLNYYLHDLFIIMNLSFPGSLSLISFEADNSADVIYKAPLLGPDFFKSNKKSNEDLFPTNTIPIGKVNNWYRQVITDVTALAENPSAKAIYVLMRLSYNDLFLNYENSLLITYAIEALFGSQIPIFILKKRIIDFFKIKKERSVKQFIDKIYKWRNMFVHGELSIPHPQINDLDDRLNDSVVIPYLKVLYLGQQLLVSTLQSFIIKDCYGLEFIENKRLLKFNKN